MVSLTLNPMITVAGQAPVRQKFQGLTVLRILALKKVNIIIAKVNFKLALHWHVPVEASALGTVLCWIPPEIQKEQSGASITVAVAVGVGKAKTLLPGGFLCTEKQLEDVTQPSLPQDESQG